MNSRTKAGIHYLLQYPSSELYRLFVDGKFHQTQNGWVGYERREPGSLKANFHGLWLVMQKLRQPINEGSHDLSVAFIHELHSACLSGVANPNLQNTGLQPGQLRNNNGMHIAGFMIEPDRATLEGLIEMLDMIESQKEHFPLYQGSWLGLAIRQGRDKPTMSMDTAIHAHSIVAIRNKYSVNNNEELAKAIFLDVQKGKYGYLAPRADYVAREMDAITSRYNLAIANVDDDDEKLKIIVDTIQQYERLHPFMDGNGRTFVNLLLNYLLMQNGFPPATFYEPNVFDMYSVDDLVIIVKNAIAVTKEIINGKKIIFDFDSDACNTSYYADMVKEINESQQSIQPLTSTMSTPTKNDEATLISPDAVNISFIESVIEEAKKTFIPARNNDEVKVTTKIPHTNISTCSGPKNKPELNHFISYTMSTENPTHQIVAFGIPLAYDARTYQDFHDYCLKERNIQGNDFDMDVKCISGYTTTTTTNKQIYGIGVVRSELSVNKHTHVKPHQLDVTLFGIHDENYINLSDDATQDNDFYMKRQTINAYLHLPPEQAEQLDSYGDEEIETLHKQAFKLLVEDRKKALWQLYEKTLKEPVLVHSASGKSIAGHFILTMEIVKHYNSIFAGNDKKKSADRIHQIVVNMRHAIPSLIVTEDQFGMAIYNSHVLRRYGLENAKKQENVSRLSMFATKQTPESYKDEAIAAENLTYGNSDFDSDHSYMP